MWAGLSAIALHVYYTELASYWMNKEGIDPLLYNFIYAPAIFGIASAFGLKGKIFQKAIWFALIPVIPCLILGQEGDPAKPGLQWVLIIGLQLPYWVGGALAGAIIEYFKHRASPNN